MSLRGTSLIRQYEGVGNLRKGEGPLTGGDVVPNSYRHKNLNIWEQCWLEVSPEPGLHMSRITELFILKTQQLYSCRNTSFTIVKPPSAPIIGNLPIFPIPITKTRKKKPKEFQDFTCCN